MCFSRSLALVESFILFSLVKFEHVTSHRIAQGKITRQNSTIVHCVGSNKSPHGTFKTVFQRVKVDWMSFSRSLAIAESLILFSLAKFENVTSHRIA